MDQETLEPSNRRNIWRALGPGLASAAALTALDETGRWILPDPARKNVVRRRAQNRIVRPADKRAAFRAGRALAGALLGKGLFHSLLSASQPRRPYLGGLLLGVAAGLGAVLLPGLLGLDARRGHSQPWRPAATIAWYLTGGLVSSGVTRQLT